MRKFLVVDDHRLFLEGMRHLLTSLGNDIELDLAQSVDEALAMLDHGTRYDLLLLDIQLPEMDGFALIQSLAQRKIILPIIIVSSTNELEPIRRCMELGASGFIHKNTSSKDMAVAIQKVLAGEISLPENLAARLEISHLANGDTVLAPHEGHEIGERQLEVLELVEQGMSNKQIALVLAISEATVKYHIGVLFKQLGVKNRTACIAKARAKGLIDKPAAP